MGNTNSFRIILALFVASSIILLIGCQQDQPKADQDQPKANQDQPKQDQLKQDQQGTAPPTEAEVKQTIQQGLTEVYMKPDGNAIPNNVDFQFGSIQVGNPVNRAINIGEEQLSYPVIAPMTIAVTFSNNPKVKTVERDNTANDTFFFYKDAFGKWNFKTGTL